jgi:hypothetical protein
MRRAVILVGFLGASCDRHAASPETCLAWCTEHAPRAEATNPESRALTLQEFELLGDRLRDVRQGLRGPPSQAMIQVCSATPCPAGASTPLGPTLSTGTTFLSMHLVVPRDGSWSVQYTRHCEEATFDRPVPAWAAPVTRAVELRGEVSGAPVVSLVDRFDVAPGMPPLQCWLEVTDPTPGGGGVLFGTSIVLSG